MKVERHSDPLPDKTRFTVRARVRSFAFAFRGLWALLRREHNAWLHLLAAVAAGGAGVWWGISRLEWCLVLFCIGVVLAAEAFNTAIESLADAVKPEPHPLVGKAKDLAAAGVLLVSIAAALVGLLVFGPHLRDTLRAWFPAH